MGLEERNIEMCSRLLRCLCCFRFGSLLVVCSLGEVHMDYLGGVLGWRETEFRDLRTELGWEGGEVVDCCW